jgi:hypothetical protein
MNTNTKFPPLPNPFSLQFNKHGFVPVPLNILNGNNKPPNIISKEEEEKVETSDIHEYYKDNSSEEMVYEEKPTIQKTYTASQPIENVFDLKNFLKK